MPDSAMASRPAGRKTLRRSTSGANLAKDNSSSRQVKDFADRIIKDHQSANDQIQALAEKLNIELEAAPKRASATPESLEEERRSRAVGSATGEYAFMAEPGMGQDAAQLKADHGAALEKLRTLKALLL